MSIRRADTIGSVAADVAAFVVVVGLVDGAVVTLQLRLISSVRPRAIVSSVAR
jgi:hypothetical protein